MSIHASSPKVRWRLNLGCGNRFHPAWTNVDFVATGPGVMSHDLRLGLPFADCAFECVYHSHVLEHFSRQEAPAFLKECFRVLQHGGVIRVAAPDLERIVRCYLNALEGAVSGDRASQDHHAWIMLELYDQTVREKPGGAMAEYLRNPPASMREFVIGRLGAQALELMPAAGAPESSDVFQSASPRRSMARRVVAMIRHPSRVRERAIKALLGHEYETLKMGRFRRGGEIHMWMYDRFSLGQLLARAGFVDPTACTATGSRIPGWRDFHLDTEIDGAIYKPDSLYMEAVKP